MTIFELARMRRLALLALYLRGVPATSPVAERYAARMSREQLVTAITAREAAVKCQAGWCGQIVNVTDPAREPYRLRDWIRCRRTATHRFSSGCVHEHLLTWMVCGQCAGALMNRWRGEMQNAQCIACRKTDGHHCQVLASAEEGAAV